MSFLSFFLGQAILAHGGAPSATLALAGCRQGSGPDRLFIVHRLMSFGFGLIFRSTAAAIAALRRGDLRPLAW